MAHGRFRRLPDRDRADRAARHRAAPRYRAVALRRVLISAFDYGLGLSTLAIRTISTTAEPRAIGKRISAAASGSTTAPHHVRSSIASPSSRACRGTLAMTAVFGIKKP